MTDAKKSAPAGAERRPRGQFPFAQKLQIQQYDRHNTEGKAEVLERVHLLL